MNTELYRPAGRKLALLLACIENGNNSFSILNYIPKELPYSGIFSWGLMFMFCDTEPFHEYLTHKNLTNILSWVEFEQYWWNFDLRKANIN